MMTASTLTCMNPVSADTIREILNSESGADATGAVMDHIFKCSYCQKTFDRVNSEQPFLAQDRLGPYVIHRHLGGGAFGDVYLAEQSNLNALRAIKILHSEHDGDDRLQQEAMRASRVNHENLVRVYHLDRVSVEGTDGRGILEMEYVHGQTVEWCLTRYKHATPRQAIQLIRQVAEGLIAMQQSGLLHGDLSARNVLIAAQDDSSSSDPEPTFDGRVKIADFGLARVLVEEGPLRNPNASEIGGTPEYLSAEQVAVLVDAPANAPTLGTVTMGFGRTANTFPVTAATDIHSLGVLFHRLLTSTFPFGDRHQVGGRSKLFERIADPAERNLPHLDRFGRDVSAIVRKCLAAERRQRYQSASEVAEDLDRHVSGRPLRFARTTPPLERVMKFVGRNRGLSVAAIAASVVMALFIVSLIVQNGRLNRALAESEANLDQASEAVEVCFTRISEHWLTDVPGMQSMRQTLLAEPIQFYSKLCERYGERPDLRGRLAEARHQLGVFRHACQQGDPEAWEALSVARDIRSELYSQEPGDGERAAALADTLTALGSVADKTKGRAQEAIPLLRLALNLRRDGVTSLPSNPKRVTALADTLSELSVTLKSRDGRSTEALTLQEEATRLMRDLPSNSANDRLSATMHHRLANLLDNHSRLISRDGQLGAIDEVSLAIDLRRRLLASSPSNTSLQYELAFSLNNRGLFNSQAGKPDQAQTDYSEAISMRRQLVQANPTVPEFEDHLAATLNNLGLLCYRLPGRAQEAWGIFAESRYRRTKLAKQGFGGERLKVALASVEENLGNLMRARGRAEEAAELYASAIHQRRDAVRAKPDRSDFRMNLVHTLTLLGQLRTNLGQWSAAHEALTEAAAEATVLMTRNPKELRFEFFQLVAEAARAECFLAQGQPAKAVAVFQSARTGAEKLVSSAPEKDEYAAFRVRLLSGLAAALAATGNPLDADTLWTVACEDGKKLTKDHRWAEHRGACCLALEGYAGHLLATKRFPESESRAKELVEHRAKLALDPDHYLDARHFAEARGLLARSREALGRWIAAADDFDAAAKLLAPFSSRTTRKADEELLRDWRAASTRCRAAAGLPKPSPEKPDSRLTRAVLAFDLASRPFENEPYDYGGFVDPSGKVKGKGLGCSGYASAVLHRLRDGDGWLARYDPKVYQLYGEKAAAHFGLVDPVILSSSLLLDTETVTRLIQEKTLVAGRLYYFNARKVTQGHVGFVRVATDGTIHQWHYSSLSSGLYKGNFAEWLRRSLYRDGGRVELYAILE